MYTSYCRLLQGHLCAYCGYKVSYFNVVFFFPAHVHYPPCFIFSRLCCAGMNPVREILFHKPRPPGLSFHRKWCSSLEGHEGCVEAPIYAQALLLLVGKANGRATTTVFVFSEEEGKSCTLYFRTWFSNVIARWPAVDCFLVLPLEFLGLNDKMFAASRLARQQYLQRPPAP